MKISIISWLLILHFIPVSSQNTGFEYKGRSTPVIKKQTLFFAKNISEIMPSFSREIILSYHDRMDLDIHLRSIDGFYTDHKKDYSQTIDFISVEISATCKGQILTSKSTNNILTAEQKSILNSVDDGTDITVKMKFKLKNYLNPNESKAGELKEGKYVVTVVPEIEAEYPGGYKQMSLFLIHNIFNIITEKSASGKIQQAMVKITINEEGRVVNPRISRSSTDPKLDKFLLDTINKMPKWRPAINLVGAKVKQEFIIPLGGTGC